MKLLILLFALMAFEVSASSIGNQSSGDNFDILPEHQRACSSLLRIAEAACEEEFRTNIRPDYCFWGYLDVSCRERRKANCLEQARCKYVKCTTGSLGGSCWVFERIFNSIEKQGDTQELEGAASGASQL